LILYLLDIDIISYLMKRPPDKLRALYRRTAPDTCAISAITFAEVSYGLEALPQGHPLRATAQAFVSTIAILDWPSSAASSYAEIRLRLERVGRGIGDRDTMIAAHAIAIDATLVTNNTRRHGRVGSPLRLESWLD
jgi:tRNA(fMet)-specific endonuclease VapC